MRRLLSGALASVGVAAVLLAGCGGDDNGAKPARDASVDSPSLGPDGTVPGTDAQSGNDTGTAACNFATFVKGLVANDTTMTALPSADLGQGCTDDQDQAEFQSLFP